MMRGDANDRDPGEPPDPESGGAHPKCSYPPRLTALATSSSFHPPVPMACQKYHRLPSSSAAVITDEFPTQATDGLAETVPETGTDSGFHSVEPIACQ